MLKITNLVKRYGKFTAVDNLCMEIDEGHIFGFVGANGAGKTTTMKIVAGLLQPTSGEVLVGGIDILSEPRTVKRKIGYMPDFFGVYDDLKVDEYMDFYAGIYGIPYRERRAITDQLLELVDLSHKRDFYVDSLSRGMKQRLCLARSLIHNPSLLILDEPASGLDPRARVEMKCILKELRNMKKTILISSHILSELSEMCTSIGIISQGKMVACGTVDEIMDKLSHSSRIKIKVRDRMEDAIRLLQEQPSIGKIDIADSAIEASFKGDDQVLAEILKRLVTQGIPVVSFTETGESLESVFMHLTEGSEEYDD
ncbi:MAG TPA: ABC transporter ATP-binding protein [Clostridiaceae bacterium]|nr:ABC transporter ATP-binding protein [Clostridiaceae bacterium]HHV99081.1 ABC transporter ATP-binding protein [Clostridiaceae bacterium]